WGFRARAGGGGAGREGGGRSPPSPAAGPGGRAGWGGKGGGASPANIAAAAARPLMSPKGRSHSLSASRLSRCVQSTLIACQNDHPQVARLSIGVIRPHRKRAGTLVILTCI